MSEMWLEPQNRDYPLISGREALGGIYGESAIYVDAKDPVLGTGRMFVDHNRADRQWNLSPYVTHDSDGKTVRALLWVNEEDAEGHFTPHSGLPLVLSGHKHIRAAVEGIRPFVEYSINDPVPILIRLRGFDQVTFTGSIKPGDEVEEEISLVTRRGDFYVVNARLLVLGKECTYINNLIVEKTQVSSWYVLLEDQIIEFAAQAAAIELLAQGDKKPLFTGIGRTRFTGLDILPGQSLIAVEQNVQFDGKRKFSGSSVVVDEYGNLVAEITNMQAIIASDTLIRRALEV